MIRGCFSSIAGLGLIALGACGAEPAGETEDTTSSTSTTAEVSTAGPTTAASLWTPDRRREDGRVQQCLDQVEAGDRCGECACNHCIDELEVCEPDPDCRAIRECAHEARCTGIDCLGPCGEVINKHGGPFSESSKLAQAIGACVDRRCAGPC